MAFARCAPAAPSKSESLSGAVSGKKAKATQLAGVDDFSSFENANSQLMDKITRNDFIGDPTPDLYKNKPAQEDRRQSAGRGKPPGMDKRSQGRGDGVMTKFKKGVGAGLGSDTRSSESQRSLDSLLDAATRRVLVSGLKAFMFLGEDLEQEPEDDVVAVLKSTTTHLGPVFGRVNPPFKRRLCSSVQLDIKVSHQLPDIALIKITLSFRTNSNRSIY